LRIVGDRVWVETRDETLDHDGSRRGRPGQRLIFPFLSRAQCANGARRFALSEWNSDLAAGAFLIRLTTREVADNTFMAILQILDVESGQILNVENAPAKEIRTKPIAEALGRFLGHCRDQTADVGRQATHPFL